MSIEITNEMNAAYDSENERDDRVIAVKMASKVSLSKASAIVAAIAKERGESAGGRKGVTDEVMAYFKEGQRTEAEFKTWLEEGHGSENIKRNFGVWNKIRQTIFDVHQHYIDAQNAEKAPAKPRRNTKAAEKAA